jgi:hypothetical protein
VLVIYPSNEHEEKSQIAAEQQYDPEMIYEINQSKGIQSAANDWSDYENINQ